MKDYGRLKMAANAIEESGVFPTPLDSAQALRLL